MGWKCQTYLTEGRREGGGERASYYYARAAAADQELYSLGESPLEPSIHEAVMVSQVGLFRGLPGDLAPSANGFPRETHQHIESLNSNKG